MDAVDQRLISILRHDGRRGISDLAHELEMSRGAVRARIARLEAGATSSATRWCCAPTRCRRRCAV